MGEVFEVDLMPKLSTTCEKIISFESCQSGFDSAIQRTIVISSLKSVRFLITSDENDKEVIKSLVGFCLGILEQVNIAGCSELKSSAQDFIIHCLSNSLISEERPSC